MAKITTSNLNNTLNTRITAGETALAAVANVVSLAITSVQIANSSYAVLDDTAANTSGTTYLVVNGSGFNSDCIVIVGNTNASSTTFANSKQLRAAVAAQNAASYPVYVTDIATGATATKINGLTFSSFPVWGTATALANVLSNTVFSTLLSANSDSSIIYSNTTILPTGTALLSNGYFYGNISIGAASATYSFDVKATDAELQDQTRTFSLTTINVPPTYTVEYLLIAGGGAGGGQGGGGAGGYTNNSVLLTSATVYTITIGSGGSGRTTNHGRSGNNTTMSGAGLTTITASGGGGGGGGYPSTGGQNGLSGGSAGGASGGAPNATVTGGIAIGSAGGGEIGTQGWPGGWASNGSSFGGGGGGAGGTGVTNGTGGPGRSWLYTGGTVYAGGGSGTPAASPAGGGGGGTNTPGTTNTGGGGGAIGGSGGSGGNGGSGVLILAVPTPNYPGSAPGAVVTTPPAAPGRTVLTFNSSGTYTA